MWWLIYRRDGQLAGATIIEAPSLYHARMTAAVQGIGKVAEYTGGNEIRRRARGTHSSRAHWKNALAGGGAGAGHSPRAQRRSPLEMITGSRTSIHSYIDKYAPYS